MTYILGIATMTDAAAVLMRDGCVVAAAEEERFSRVKHQGGFPHRAIRAALAAEGIGVDGLDEVAVYWNPWKVGHRARELARTAVARPGLMATQLRRVERVWRGRSVAGADDAPGGGWGGLFRLRAAFRAHFGRPPRRIRYLDHHASHAASAFFGSDFDEAALLVLDGSGEAACTTTGVGRGTAIQALDRHLVPHSLGHFYSAVTGYLGFPMLDGEYKVMGLSPYGDPAGAAWIRRHWLRSVGPGRYRLEPGVLDYHRALRGDFRGAFARHFGPPRAPDEGGPVDPVYADVAASAQRALEEVVLDVARELRRRTGLPRLAVAGGCALNCAALGKVLQEGIFDEVYVPPAPHDAGGALGAAMLRHAQRTGRRPRPVRDARLGPAIGGAEARAVLDGCPDATFQELPPEELARRAARRIADGGVVAWATGGMEFGPRALGARSFLASPLEEGNRDLLNEKIKKREPFRPFAPSVLAERAAEYFRLQQPAPFMSLIVPVRAGQQERIPAVTHVDGTARPQTVCRDSHPVYWLLIREFERITGVAAVLNTSFNIQEPIVCTAGDALRTFLRSGADALVLGGCWVERAGAADRPAS
jgi:carbamoyltransferase